MCACACVRAYVCVCVCVSVCEEVHARTRLCMRVCAREGGVRERQRLHLI